MAARTTLITALTAVGLLSGCTFGLLAPEDRRHVCRVEVVEQYEFPVLRASPLSHPASGVAAGAAGGALAGLMYGIGPQFVVTVPLGAVIGATGGAVCGAAALSHPDAEAEFQQMLEAAGPGVLKRAMEADLNAPRAGCERVQADATAGPDTIVELERADVDMGCALGRQEYFIGVTWRALTAADQRVLATRTTHCRHTSYRDFDAWFANPDAARAEIGRVLAVTGQRIAAELLSTGLMSDCVIRSGKSGATEETSAPTTKRRPD
jgi:hypothetical protein